MNFEQIFEATRELCVKKHNTTFCDWATRELKEKLNRVNLPGWEKAELEAPKFDMTNDIPIFYLSFKEELQFIGMSMSNGNEEYDKMIYDDLTEVLAALREVIIWNFQIELPEARVVSMTTEMVEGGFLEYCRDENGVLCVRPNENPFNIQIKIIKTPDGPAPEEFRQKEVGLVLPARRLSKTGLMEGYDECYRVPKIGFIEALRQISSEAADCLANLFQEDKALLFHIDEAEIVP